MNRGARVAAGALVALVCAAAIADAATIQQGDWGYLDRIKLTLKRKYRDRGRELSYFNSGCPAPGRSKRVSFPLAYAEFFFAGRKSMGTSVPKTCGVAP